MIPGLVFKHSTVSVISGSSEAVFFFNLCFSNYFHFSCYNFIIVLLENYNIYYCNISILFRIFSFRYFSHCSILLLLCEHICNSIKFNQAMMLPRLSCALLRGCAASKSVLQITHDSVQ